MNDPIPARLEELRAEREKGLAMLADLEKQTAALREQLLRISGAIDVLEELQNRPSVSPEE